MPVMLTEPAEWDAWLKADAETALKFQRPFPVDLQRRLGTSRAVPVQAKYYGTDNTCLLDALEQLGADAAAFPLWRRRKAFAPFPAVVFFVEGAD